MEELVTQLNELKSSLYLLQNELFIALVKLGRIYGTLSKYGADDEPKKKLSE